nr:unnamed protein product [Spirometra erinaceieuropaei]
MGRAFSRRPQPPLHRLRRRHRPFAAIGDQLRPRPPVLSPGNQQGRAAALQREGPDAIPAENYRHGGLQLMEHSTSLFQEMWRQGDVSQDFKDATIVHPWERKGNRQLCDNHRDISLLNIIGKIFARILLNRLNNHLEQGLLPGKPVRLPPSSRDHGYDLYRPSTSGDVPGDADPPVLYLPGPDDSLRHGESLRAIEDHAEIRLPRAIHLDDASAPRR